MITDLLATRQRFNQPGSTGEANWSQRLDRELTAYDADDRFAAKINLFATLIKKGHRLPVEHLPAARKVRSV